MAAPARRLDAVLVDMAVRPRPRASITVSIRPLSIEATAGLRVRIGCITLSTDSVSI
jgi:hypothetical protein